MTVCNSICFFVLFALSTCDCCIYSPQTVFKSPRLPPLSFGETRFVYHHDQTIATFDYDYAGQILRCEVTDVSQWQDVEIIHQQINYLQPYIFNEISLYEMLMHIKKCDEFDIDPKYNPIHSLINTKLILLANFGSVFQKILPGTKWCGPGDIAKSYRDLGKFRDIDRCCRAHDLCPTKIEANGTRYGLYSFSPITTLDCACDRMFYSCLESISSKGANMVGSTYFNFAQKTCILDVPSYNAKMIVPLDPNDRLS